MFFRNVQESAQTEVVSYVDCMTRKFVHFKSHYVVTPHVTADSRNISRYPLASHKNRLYLQLTDALPFLELHRLPTTRSLSPTRTAEGRAARPVYRNRNAQMCTKE